MATNEDCRHYVMQTVRGTDRLERCRLGANTPLPFSCPDGCVFFESRRTSSAGWHVADPKRRPEAGGSAAPS